MTVGVSPTQGDLWKSSVEFCEPRIDDSSIYGVLHRECFSLFPDSDFEDLFAGRGRASVPPMIVAVVMVLQRLEGLSDREAVDRFTFDLRWKYAAGGLDVDYPGFVHSVLVETRARLARSDRPNRIFDATLNAAKRAGMVGRKRVLDSTAVYDAVATMDTVTLIRSAIRALLKVCDVELSDRLRELLRRDDDYQAPGKPVCEWSDERARKQLVDDLAKDAAAVLSGLTDCEVPVPVAQAAELLATVVGQDLVIDEDGVSHIVRGVAKDRVISAVDPEARHGHKTSAHSFDGYKAHVAIDPDSEIITATSATAGNAGDAGQVSALLADDLPDKPDTNQSPAGAQEQAGTPVDRTDTDPDPDVDSVTDIGVESDTNCGPDIAPDTSTVADADAASEEADVEPLRAFGDAAYGSGDVLADLEDAGVKNFMKVQPPVGKGGMYPKDQFDIDLEDQIVTCPDGKQAPIRPTKNGGGTAKFKTVCAQCPLAQMCTKSVRGRTIKIGPHEAELTRARLQQQDPAWKEEYRATRPKVERKFGHLMRRRHGGRRARMRGLQKVGADFSLLAAATNVARLGQLRYHLTTATDTELMAA